MFRTVVSCSLGLAAAQQAGTLQPETHPEMIIEMDCTEGGCRQERAEVVIDANWRWVQKGGQNCYRNDNTWDPAECSDAANCAKECSVEGADYAATYGITPNGQGDGMNLKFVTHGQYSSNFGSRLYVMDTPDTYKIFKLLNREFSFEVDVSNLPCGLNGALYFVEMDRYGDKDGVGNTAGAKYGTGYCDAQCPHDIKFIKGEANSEEWNATAMPPTGRYGACCAEMDIWEANSMATAFTPHVCTKEGLTKCAGLECGDTEKGERYMGICDKDGCDYNGFRLGKEGFYGKGNKFDVDTAKPVQVVTQFITIDGTDTGELVEIKRFYVQDGEVIPNSEASILGGHDSVTEDFCSAQKQKFGDPNDYGVKGGMKNMGKALERGMVLVFSLWDDVKVHMLWLDSAYPLDQPRTKPGVLRGPCPGGDSSAPAYLRSAHANADVAFSKFKVGSIGSTIAGKPRRMSQSFV